MERCYEEFEKGDGIMKWLKVKGEAYYPAFKCSECGETIVVEDECLLPCYCKNCESEVEE